MLGLCILGYLTQLCKLGRYYPSWQIGFLSLRAQNFQLGLKTQVCSLGQVTHCTWVMDIGLTNPTL